MEQYRSGHNGLDSKSCYLCVKLNIIHTEAYRSGHNGTDSKSVVRQRTVGSNPTASAKKALKTKRFQGFALFIRGARFATFCQNGARGARICGALYRLLYSLYSHKMYAVVPQWCPKPLKTYKKQRGAIKRYIFHSSISLLFFFVFFGAFLLLVSFSELDFCGCRAL